jgi:diguanylate cyclase (GGDEF)-like protein
VTFAVVSNAAVAMACLAYPDPQGALTGCISFATIAAYIAFFHSTALVLYNFAVAATVAVVAASRIAASGHLALAAVDLFLVAQVNIAMPVAIHVLVRALGGDVEQADRDPLTGLLNRRAFQLHAVKMLRSDPTATGGHLVVAMVDLDDFKRINDTRGHQAGDDALVAVGHALRSAFVDATAVIARTGGEEFNVAVVGDTADPQPIASRICEAIAGLPEAVTASVGTASAQIESLPGDGTRLRASLNRLVADADEAMYAAKRAGGNRYHHFDDQLL